MRLLIVDGCISQRGGDSRTKQLLSAYAEAFRRTHPEVQTETVTPQALLALRPFDPAMLDERDALAAVGAWDAPVFALARQFRAADAVVEYISANGLTYHYEADGCHGDCRAQRLVYLTSGGDVEREDSLGVLYWRQLAAMFGIPQFDYVFAGGVDLDPAKAPELVAAAAETARRLAEEV